MQTRTAMPVGEPDAVVQGDDREVDGQQQAAAEVAHGPAARGDPVALVLGRRSRTGSRRRRPASAPSRCWRTNSSSAPSCQLSPGDEEHQRGEGRAGPGEAAPSARFLCAAAVRDARRRSAARSAEKMVAKRDDVEDQRAGRDREPEHVTGLVHLRSSSPTKPQAAFSATEVRYGANSTGRDRRDVGGVGPVVPVPGPLLLAPVERRAGRRCRPRSGWSSWVVPPLAAPGEHLLEHVGPVGDQAVDAEVEQLVHLRRLVDGPDVHVGAGGVRAAYERTGDDRQRPAAVRHLQRGDPAARRPAGAAGPTAAP